MLKHKSSVLQSVLHRRGQMSTTAIVFLVLGIVFFVMVVIGAVLGCIVAACRSAGTGGGSADTVEE